MCVREYSLQHIYNRGILEQMPNNKELMNYGMSIRQNTIQLPKYILLVWKCIRSTVNKKARKCMITPFQDNSNEKKWKHVLQNVSSDCL